MAAVDPECLPALHVAALRARTADAAWPAPTRRSVAALDVLAAWVAAVAGAAAALAAGGGAEPWTGVRTALFSGIVCVRDEDADGHVLRRAPLLLESLLPARARAAAGEGTGGPVAALETDEDHIGGAVADAPVLVVQPAGRVTHAVDPGGGAVARAAAAAAAAAEPQLAPLRRARRARVLSGRVGDWRTAVEAAMLSILRDMKARAGARGTACGDLT